MNTYYKLEKIKFGVDKSIWTRAVDLYQKGKVKNFDDNGYTFTAKVQGTHLYNVFVSKKRYEDGDCTCYMGQNDYLCKHMVAVAIYGLKRGKPLTNTDTFQHNKLVCSNKIGTLSQGELSLTRAEINGAMRYIKAYEGPSRTWFAYQNSLTEGCSRLSFLFSKLPVDIQTANLIVKTLIRLDKKLTGGGVDDSDGTVGEFIEETVELLIQYIALKPKVKKAFKQLNGIESCFGWEEKLL